MADNITNIQHVSYQTKSYKLTTDKAQDNTYINIRANTPMKFNLLNKYWFTEESDIVLKDLTRKTTQCYYEWVNITINSQLIMIKTKMKSKSNMAESNMA